jgi:hypothetical protein
MGRYIDPVMEAGEALVVHVAGIIAVAGLERTEEN